MVFSVESNPQFDEQKKQNKQKAMALYMRGKYKEVCDFVDGLYGWNSGEVGKRQFTKEEAEWCLKQL
jgi:hypothetical protein